MVVNELPRLGRIERVFGIPTEYSGVRFRSRLEARWAAFFDACGWTWDYEPLDLAGYIPDFALHWHRPVIVEVKPALSLGEMSAAQAKIDRSGWDGEAIVLGARIWGDEDGHLGVIGTMREVYQVDDGTIGRQWGPACLFHCLSCDQVSVYHGDLSWRCRASGCEGRHIDHWTARPLDVWRHAGNEVQWHRKLTEA